VLLVFAALGAVFLLSLYQLALGRPPQVLSVIAIVLLLGQPALTLRLASRIHPIRRGVIPVAVAAWLGIAVPLVILETAVPILLVAAIACFVVTEAVAAGYLVVAARRRAGGGAIRLWTAAAGTALLGIALLTLAGSALPGDARSILSPIARGSALLAAIGYVVAFLPPGFLQDAWRSETAYDGLRALLALSDAGPGATWAGLLRLARASTGAVGAFVAEGPIEAARVAAVDGLAPELLGTTLTGPVAGNGERPIEAWRADPSAAPVIAAARQAGGRFVRTVDLGADPAVRIVLFLSHQTLFGDEDERLLDALGRQAAGLVARQRLAAQLAETVAALRAASQAKSDFIASMSHELRTPLNAILGFSDLMRHEPPSPERSVTVPLEWVEHIHRGGSHLAELINDVLDLAKVEAGRLELDRTSIDVLPVVGEVVNGLRPLADRKALQLEVDVPPGVFASADRGRLRQVLYNLLSNAIKFTPDGGRIGVAVRRVADEVHLAVEDTGIGIAPADQEAVFDEFRQVGANAQRQDGTGLGLALTRRLLQAHAGRIELESTPGVGSRFTAVLPAGDPTPEVDPDTVPAVLVAPAELPTGRKSILVVEDDPGAARLIRAYLEPEGYAVQVASTGPEALDLAAAHRPAAIVLDLLLPGMDGWEVLRRLKASRALQATPVIIVTVVDEKDVGLALGAADYLLKPVERDALLASVRRLTQGRDRPNRPVSVLAIDDEPATLDLLDQALAPAGFEVIRSTGGVMGVQLARARRPDLVVCDLVMPDLDGFGVVAALRADPATADVPIVILTGHELTAVDKQRLHGHVLGIVTKGPSAEIGLRAWLAAATA
jgi:signal transduction histidine kinase/DNA-binding response OmpR family regulator